MDLKKAALEIFSNAVKAADPYFCIKKSVILRDGENGGQSVIIGSKEYPTSTFKNIYVVGGGKASARMGQALEEILGDRITGGWINTKDEHAVPLKHITVHECSHPVPDSRGVEGTEKIIDILSKADESTLVICLLSGGGSALMPAPAEGITIEEKQEVTKLLLSAGADIGELNAIRKHLSSLKGGGMARFAAPAALHVLILSDVIGDRLDTIASGPAVSDSSTFSDCFDICTKYGVTDLLPPGVLERFKRGVNGEIPETAKPGDEFLTLTENTLIGNNVMSVNAARTTAESMGFNTIVLSTFFRGEASELGTFFASIASEILMTGNPVKTPVCIIGGGETTVTVRGKGMGGRNQEMALSAAFGISGLRDVVFLSGGTDGTDGPTDAAGGIVDGNTINIGKEQELNYNEFMGNNDSYHYLKATGDLLITGPTGTNVMDIQILLAGEQA
ncbi:glycerate kinase [Candidatus Latescibacterota bacterium]